MSANDAAAIAIQLFRLDARLCDQHPMKVARTTDNPSVSGNTLQEATTSLACCSSTQDLQRLSHNASVQTNPCTVFQVNPVHTTDLSRSLSDAQITQTSSTCSQTDSNDTPPTFIIVSTPGSSAKEQKSSSIAPIDSMAQKQDDTSAQVSSEEDLLNNTDNHIKLSEQNGTTEHSINKNILDNLDVASLNIPDCLILHDLHDINLAVMENAKKPLKHIASFQTGNFIIFSIVNYILNYQQFKYFS